MGPLAELQFDRPLYALLMLASLLAGGWLLRRRQQRLALDRRQKLAIGLGAFCGAMIGSKLPFWIAQFEPGQSFTVWLAHGKTIMGGIVGGYLGVELAKWSLDIRIKTGDSFAAPVALAVTLGRCACFQGGCCYGAPTSLPWGVVFPSAVDDPTAHRHPTQLYEAAFHGAALLVLLWLDRRKLLQGQQLKAYLLAYLGYRFTSEYLRPETRLAAGLTAYQWAALALAPVFIGLWIRDARAAAARPAAPSAAR